MREAVLRETRLKCRIAVEATPGVHQELRRATQQKAYARRATLQHIIQDPENLLVVRVSGLGMGQLVEVDHLIQQHEQAAIAGEAHERSIELQVIVDALVIDDVADPQRRPCFGSRAVFRPQPAQRRRFLCLVTLVVRLRVSRQNGREIEARHEVSQRSELLLDGFLDILAVLLGLHKSVANEPLDDAVQCSAFGLRPGGSVPGELVEQ